MQQSVIGRLFKRNNTPLANSVVGHELVSKVRITLEPLVAHSGRVALEDESSTIRRIGIGTNHEHGTLSVQLLFIIPAPEHKPSPDQDGQHGKELSSPEFLRRNRLHIRSRENAYTSRCSTSGSLQQQQKSGPWWEHS